MSNATAIGTSTNKLSLKSSAGIVASDDIDSDNEEITFDANSNVDATTNNTIRLKSSRYGKDKVRVFRVVRSPNGGDSEDGKHWHEVVEYNVCLLVEGDIDLRCVFFSFLASFLGLLGIFVELV